MHQSSGVANNDNHKASNAAVLAMVNYGQLCMASTVENLCVIYCRAIIFIKVHSLLHSNPLVELKLLIRNRNLKISTVIK